MPPIRPIRIGGMLYIFRYDEGREAYRQNVRSSAYSLPSRFLRNMPALSRRSSTLRSPNENTRRTNKRPHRNCGRDAAGRTYEKAEIRHPRPGVRPPSVAGHRNRRKTDGAAALGTDVRQTRARTEDENKDTEQNPIPFEMRTSFPGIPTKHDICRVFPTEQKNKKHEKHNIQKRRPDASAGTRNVAGETR